MYNRHLSPTMDYATLTDKASDDPIMTESEIRQEKLSMRNFMPGFPDLSSIVKPKRGLVRASTAESLKRLDDSLFEFTNPYNEKSVEVQPTSILVESSEVDMNLPFPIKLHYILSTPQYQDCVSWLPHGRAWLVTDQTLFEKKVIPKFFRSDRYASFMRQVNGWAFNRITEGPDVNAYYHDMFLRGIPNLCFNMKRPPKVKHAAAAARIAAGAGFGAPDFHRISKLAPLPPSLSFKPILNNTKAQGSSNNNNHKYVIKILDEIAQQKKVDSDQSMCDSKLESKKDSRSNEEASDEDDQPLSQADIMYLEHQNEILFQHAGLPEKKSVNSRQA